MTTSGTVGLGGQLTLNAAPLDTTGTPLKVNSEFRNWRSRADVPGRMTGTFRIVLTAPGFSGSAIVDLRLRNMNRQGATATTLPTTGLDEFGQAFQELARRLELSRQHQP